MELFKPQQYRARVADKFFVSDSERYLEIKLELVVPNRIEFAAGQYVSIKVNEQGVRRSYSIASTPDVEHGIELLAEIIEGGKGSEYFLKTQPGDEVEILGPLGKFVVEPGEGERKLLFVATGSGIVPIKAMIEDLLINKQEKRPIRLHWGMRSEQDLFWFDNFLRLSEEHENFVFDQVLSRPGEEWSLCSGRVQDCLSRDFQDGLSEWEGYVCGHPEKVESIANTLAELGMQEDKISFERFT